MTINWPVIIFCGVSISILLTFIVIPQILHISFAKRLFDKPEKRKVHKGIIPRLGGFTFLPVVLLTMGIILAFLQGEGAFEAALGGVPWLQTELPSVMVLLGAMTVLFFIGLVDDLIGVKYMMKFFAQTVAAVMLVVAGIVIMDFHGLVGIWGVGTGIAALISFFLIIYILNAVNLIDGIDGLASGLCTIALCLYGIVLYAEAKFLFSVLAWIGAATVAVFWCFNVFGSVKRHTKIFMGDIGSLTLGVMIAFMAIVIGGGPDEIILGVKDPLIIAFSPLIMPLLDVIRVFFERLISGASPFLPDKRHIHHKMLARGVNGRIAMLIMLMLQVAIIIVDIWIAQVSGINMVLLVDVLIYICVVLVFTPRRKAAV